MKELSKEVVGEVIEYYGKYKIITAQKKNLTDHNRDMKNDFMETHFDEDEYEVEDLKRIKKEITKYFNTIEEVGSGSDPVVEIKDVRKNYLNLKDDVYSSLMKIFDQIQKNNTAKESLDALMEKEVYLPLVVKMGLPMDNVKGILKLNLNIETGKSDITMNIVDDYRTLIGLVGKYGI